VDTTCLVRDNGAWLYALGDVHHRALLTHQGKYQARTAGDAIGARAAGRPVDDAAWGDHATTADQHAVAQVFFTDPEAAAVGLTAEQAADAGHRVRTVDLDFDAAQGANLFADNYQGHARLVVDVEREVLLGVTFVGPGVSELLHSATIAVAGEVPLKRLRHAIAPFPTVSEIWLFLLAAYQRDQQMSHTTSA
jgi:dihydrolipoamide dehydrogenase